MSIKVDKRNLTNMRNNTDEKTNTFVRSLALQVEAEAKKLSPKDTGTNANSIYTRTSRNESAPVGSTTELPKPDDFSAYVGPSTNYGIFLELGTEHINPRPYMVPALRKIQSSVKEEAKKII